MSKGATGSVLVFVSIVFSFTLDHLSNAIVKAGLFSSVVATFLALSIPDLRNRNGPLTSTLSVNILWLLSLVLSLGSALAAGTVQEWAETYQKTEAYQTPETSQMTETHQTTEIHQTTETYRGPLPAKLGLLKKFLDYTSALLMVLSLGIMHALLEISVLSFFIGLIIYVWNIHTTAGHFVLGFVIVIYSCRRIVMAAIDARLRTQTSG